MIVKMRKVTIVVSQVDIDSALSGLRKLGIVHIENLRQPQNEYIDTLRRRLARIGEVLGLIGNSKEQKKLNKEELISVPKDICRIQQEKEKLKEQQDEYKQKLNWFNQWADISQTDLEELARAHIFVRLYICSKKELGRVGKDKLVYIIKQKGSSLGIVFISHGKDEKLDLPSARPIEVPQESLKTVKTKLAYLEDKIGEKEAILSQFSVYRNCFFQHQKKLLKKLEFVQVKFGMVYNQSLAWLSGYCPVNAVGKLKSTADKKSWGLIVAKPDKLQEVPTLLKNPRWVNIIKPVFNFMGTLPGYKEHDISFWFLLFFSLFFAMIVGDAGYGLLFFVATYLVRRKFKKAPAEPFFLAYLLSAATIVWGALSGNWFGAEAIANIPLFNALVVERIDGFIAANRDFMIYFYFLLGVVHLTIARAIKALRYIGSFKVLAEIGWIFILWAAFFIAGQFAGRPVPNFILPLVFFGIALVVLFSNFQKNILKGALVSLGTLPLDVISSFTDIISYIRLFAVGYATLAIAAAFNDMALGIGLGGLLGGLISAVIIFLGHSLNIMLCLMSVIVHGVRLNLLEFSGQLGMEWSGVEYRPFREEEVIR